MYIILRMYWSISDMMIVNIIIITVILISLFIFSLVSSMLQELFTDEWKRYKYFKMILIFNTVDNGWPGKIKKIVILQFYLFYKNYFHY